MKIRRQPYLLLAVFALFFVLLYPGQTARAGSSDAVKSYHCITPFEGGSINWSTGSIRAIGNAFPNDKKLTSHDWVKGAARADANRHIIKILKGIKLTNTRRVEQYAAKNDVILAGIEKTARDATILRQYYTSALAVEMTIETTIFGGFLQLVLPDDIRQIPKINLEVTGENSDKAIREPAYTGLVIDTIGLGFEPVLNPVIISEHGHDVYSPAYISREFAVKNGVAKYICSMTQALKDSRVGNHPLVVKALRKEGIKNTSLVINLADYRTLEKSPERHVFLKECRVIIVKDS